MRLESLSKAVSDSAKQELGDRETPFIDAEFWFHYPHDRYQLVSKDNESTCQGVRVKLH
jgi:hypothetical protein